MTVTPYSIFTALLLCNIFIIVIAFIQQCDSFIIRFSLVPFVLLIAAGIFRMIFFIEVPNTFVLGSDNIFPNVLNFLNTQLFTVYNTNIVMHTYDILIAVWVIGSIYSLTKYVYKSINLYRFVRYVPDTNDTQIISCMNNILVKTRNDKKVKIIQSEDISIPIIAGYFKPVICLPNMDFSNNELENILLHEWTHFLHKDAWVKLFVYSISSLFWWNPFVHILKKELNNILEIRCDLSITSKMDEKARIRYLKSIVKVMKAACKSSLVQNIPMNCAALVSTNKLSKIEQRFYLVIGYDLHHNQRILPAFLLSALILLSFLASYKIAIQPRFLSPAESGYEETFTISPENSYLIVNENGTYSLYSDNEYRCDIEKIDEEPFSSLPIK